MANKLIDNNKINKEPKSNQTAHDRGVGSSDFVRHLSIDISIRFINICQHINTLPLLHVHYSTGRPRIQNQNNLVLVLRAYGSEFTKIPILGQPVKTQHHPLQRHAVKGRFDPFPDPFPSFPFPCQRYIRQRSIHYFE